MALSSISKQFQKGFSQIQKRIESAFEEAKNPNTQKIIGDFVLNLIVKRTRLGFGVNKNFGEKQKFPKHSEKYIRRRERFAGLSSTTSPNKSNLTFTGQLLESTKVIKAANGQIRISPTGSRSTERLTNLELADILESKGRIYNRISQLEYQQLIRFYRKTFGDLLRKRKLLR